MDVSTQAGLCLEMFNRCLKIESGHWVEDQLFRFNLWTANSDALERDHASMDWRLRNNPELREMMVQLLVVLEKHLVLLGSIGAKNTTYDTHVTAASTWSASSTSSSSVSSSLKDAHMDRDPVSNAKYAISETLDRLFRLLTAIRKSGLQNRHAKAAEFVEYDGTVNLTEAFKTCALQYVKFRHPHASEDLQGRLAETISLRQRQLAYSKKRRQKTDSMPKKRSTKTDSGHPIQGSSISVVRSTAAASSTPAGSKAATLEIGSVGSTQFSASEIDPRLVPKHVPSKASSTSSNGTKIQSSELYLPSPPKIPRQNKEFECPYCFIPYPREKFRGEKWRYHILEDLQPYVCVLEDCSRPYALFHRTRDWLQHMQWDHTVPKWTCTAAGHRSAMAFESEKDFQEHMNSQHAKEFDNVQLQMLTERSLVRRLRTEVLSICPLCNGVPADAASAGPDGIREHVAQHLRSLSLISLSWLYDSKPDDEIDSVSSKQTKMSQAQGQGQDSRAGLEKEWPWSLWDIREPLSFRSEGGGDADQTDEFTLDPHVEPLNFVDKENFTMDDCWQLIWEFKKRHFQIYEGHLNDPILQNFVARYYAELRSIGERQDFLLRSLQDFEADSRFEDVTVAHAGTFQWIFLDDTFQRWLHGKEDLFWISGKSGSGKSTLMKYIVQHKETEIRLEMGSELPVVIATYFFSQFRAIQGRTVSGMLRSLLFQILSDHRELISTTIVTESIDSKSLSHGDWTKEELQTAFGKMLRRGSRSMKVYLFIDGLDECEGDLSHLASCLKEGISYRNVKVCVASRPRPIFTDTFRSSPTLQMQECTGDDIHMYVTDKLTSLDPAISTLIPEIVSHSEGVFLYAILFVASIERQLHNGTPILNLQSRFDLLPSGLDDAYTRILNGLDPADRQAACSILRLVHAAETEKQAIDLQEVTLALSFTVDSGAFQRLCKSSTHEEKLIQECKRTHDLIISSCRTLLEIRGEHWKEARVTYSHATVGQYLGQPGVVALLEEQTGSDFYPFKRLLESCLMRIVLLCQIEINQTVAMPRNTVERAFRYAQRCDCDDEAYFNLLDELNSSMQFLFEFRGDNWSVQTIDTKEWVAYMFADDVSSSSSVGRLFSGNEKNSFLSLAVQYGLCQYVRSRIGANPSLGGRDGWRQLLHYAVAPAYVSAGLPDRMKMVQQLLDCGVNPNELFNEVHPWSLTLRYIHSKNSVTAEDLQVLRLLLNAGADPTVESRTTDGQLIDPRTFIDAASEQFPRETSTIRQYLDNNNDADTWHDVPYLSYEPQPKPKFSRLLNLSRASEKTYFFPKTWETPPPPSGPVGLGRIFSDEILTSPTSESVDLAEGYQIELPEILTSVEENVQVHLKPGSILKRLWRFLGIEVKANDVQSDTKLFIDRVETMCFRPNWTYTSTILTSAALIFERNKIKRPLYLVTGVRIADGARVVQGKRAHRAEIPVGSSPGVPSANASVNAGISTSSDGTFLLAYRLDKLVYEFGIVRSVPFTDGATI